MGRYLEMSGASVGQWSRRAEAEGGVTLADVCLKADIVLLAISDGAIGEFVSAHADLLSDKTLVHFSGALSFDGMSGAHPLYSFSREPVPKVRMEQIVFVTEKGGKNFTQLFPTLTNKHAEISSSQKPLYHALAVLSGNLASFVWNEVAQKYEDELGLPPCDLLLPYFQSLIDGFALSPSDSLTGPLKRADQRTIDKNLTALEGHPSLNILYKAFLTAYAQRSER